MINNKFSSISILKRLLPFLLRYKKYIVIAGISMFVSITLQLPLPLLTKYIIDNLIDSGKIHILGVICICLFCILIVRTLALLVERYYFTLFRLRVVYDLKRCLYEYLMKMSLSYFYKKQTGYIISRISSDVEGVQGLFAETFLMIIHNLLTFIVGIIMIYYLNVKLAIIATLLIPFYFISLLVFNKKIRKYVEENREEFAHVFRYLQEHISGIAVIKAFVVEKHDTIGMLHSLKKAIKKEYKASMTGTIATLTAGFISSLSPILLLWLGIIEIVKGRFTLGGLIAFNSFLVYLFSPLNSISNINITVQNSLVCAKRLFEFLDQTPEIPLFLNNNNNENNVLLEKGHIQFENINFSYNNDSEYILNNISFDVPAGKITAIVGHSGAGKSTLINLLFRFYDYKSGQIYIDEKKIKEYNIKYLRNNIGLVSQETFLFGCSILDNIKIGNLRASYEDVVNAAKSAYAHEFIMRLPEKYNTKIGERGNLISGGERQRIALARVILKNPRILILDEATSSLDSQSEMYIKKIMEKLYHDRTVIVIAHRLSTIDNVDQIVFIEHGKIVDIGNHSSLYQNCELYKKMYDEQYNKTKDNSVMV